MIYDITINLWTLRGTTHGREKQLIVSVSQIMVGEHENQIYLRLIYFNDFS